ncbi:hypothetical protein [Nitratireductor pacificus]|uniref:Uncharacterized protein n=1 Tax=Nitratireductor pacificus pht-3B TaxID=391937 RepID=K2MHV5_9HYPH|nr:hypothetical protein [Nitratireductor pacificus]EKF20320.1 hypothetical protein NA2_03662 [Nitratireductor pacificus pht-3B]
MTGYRNRLLAGLAGSILALSLAAPAAAIDLGGISVGDNGGGGLSVDLGAASVSVGTSNGVSANVGADLGGATANVGASALSSNSIADVNADATVGGSNGITASSSTTVGSGGNLVDSNTTASVGGNRGLTAGVGATVGSGGINTNINLGLGRPNATTPPGTTPPGTTPPGSNPGGIIGDIIGGGRNNAARAVSGLSNRQLAVYRKRCVSILRDPNAWDYDLVQMCRALRQAAAR